MLVSQIRNWGSAEQYQLLYTYFSLLQEAFPTGIKLESRTSIVKVSGRTCSSLQAISALQQVGSLAKSTQRETEENCLLFRGFSSSMPSSSFSGSISSAWVIQSKYPFKSSSSCCFSRNFWKSPRALAFSLSLENSLARGREGQDMGGGKEEIEKQWVRLISTRKSPHPV